MKKPVRRYYHKLLPALLVCLLIVLLTGCSSRPSAEEIIDNAIDAASELQTYRFEITSTTTMEGETHQGNVRGEFVSPDRLHAIVVNDGENEEGIIIGQMEYQRSVNGDWEEHEWPAGWFARNNLALSTVEMLDSLIGLVKLPDEEIDGVNCFHYRGNIDIEAQVEERIANLDPTQQYYDDMVKAIEQQLQSEQTVEFWIGQEDYLLRRADMQADMSYTEDEGKDTEEEVSVDASYSIRFYDFDQPIQIEPPVVG